MNKKEHIENQVERALQSLDGVQRAVANPFLYTRVKARLDADERGFWNVAANFLSKPAVLIASFLLLVSLNSVFILQTREKSADLQADSDETQYVANDYNLAQTAFYDQTIDQNDAVAPK